MSIIVGTKTGVIAILTQRQDVFYFSRKTINFSGPSQKAANAYFLYSGNVTSAFFACSNVPYKRQPSAAGVVMGTFECS